MKNKALLSIIFIAFCVLIANGSTAASAAEPAKASTKVKIPAKGHSLQLSYDVYAGGFKALHADFDIKLDPNAYDASLVARTQGMIGGIFPWQASYRTAGHTRDNVLVPNQHTARSAWKASEKLTELHYSPQGNLLKMTTQEDGKTTTKRDIKKELSADSVDLLTGAVLMIQSAKLAQSDTCTGSFPVFDGKRRYNITLYGGGPDTIRKSDYSVYSGKALKCFLRVEPVAGFVPKDQKRGWMAVQNHTLARKKPPTIWFAQVAQDGPAVPVRMEINSAYGAAVAHLTASNGNTADKK